MCPLATSRTFIATDNVVRYLNEIDSESQHLLQCIAPSSSASRHRFHCRFSMTTSSNSSFVAEKTEEGRAEDAEGELRRHGLTTRRCIAYNSVLEDDALPATHAKLTQVLREAVGQNGAELALDTAEFALLPTNWSMLKVPRAFPRPLSSQRG